MAAGFAAEFLTRAKEQAPVLVQRVKSYCPGACADGTGPGGPSEGTGLRGGAGTEMSNFQK